MWELCIREEGYNKKSLNYYGKGNVIKAAINVIVICVLIPFIVDGVLAIDLKPIEMLHDNSKCSENMTYNDKMSVI